MTAPPATNIGQACCGLLFPNFRVMVQNNAMTISSVILDQLLPGSETHLRLIIVMRKYDGVSQNADSPYARATIPAARSQTRQSRSPTQTDQVKMGNKIASEVAP